MTEYDRTYVEGKEFGVITCPKCDCRVLYGIDASTRPRYCPECEEREFYKLKDSMYWDRIPSQVAVERIRRALRMPMPLIHKKCIQEFIS